ncbi:hypothetical protein FIE12Z_11815 [Fusarium flagelliforme]|uniref:F-box domain-containing protein n=1 Tax=Fusarium flagelliforme TaxID=2675880 RepID=A0A395M7Z7_9HYPO|nr:hypothetical protein FIE12Z_11815 [Fusarium flagelliforme]
MSGNAQNMVASLEVLPPEIMLPIVTSLPGLDTLWNLMTASPNTWRLFNNYALTITEGIISGPNSILYEKIRELVRGVILVRAKTLPFEDLNEFKTRFLKGVNSEELPDMNARFLKGLTPSLQQLRQREFMTLEPDSLSASIVSAEVLRAVVATAYQISALSQGCLTSYLASFRDIRPLHPSQAPSDLDVNSEPVKVADAGQPSWTEEMRALRAMWIIQLVGEMKRLDKESWSEEELDKLKQMNAADLLERPESVIKAEEIRSAMDYLTTLVDTTQDSHYRLPIPPLATKRRRWITAERKSFRYDASLVRRLDCKSLRQRRAEFRADREPVSMAVNNPVLSDDDRWGSVEPRLYDQSFGVGTWRFLSNHRRSPVYGVKFDSFRRLGFAFLDKKRLNLAGLADGIHRPYHGEDFYSLALLESILPADEVASIEADIPLRPTLVHSSAQTLPPGMSMRRSRSIPHCRPGNSRPAPPL